MSAGGGGSTKANGVGDLLMGDLLGGGSGEEFAVLLSSCDVSLINSTLRAEVE